LAAWGWQFTLGLVNADQNDQVQIEVRYSTAATTPPSPLRTLLASTWSPDDLLASLYIIKLLQDNWAAIQQVTPAPPTPRDPLAALDALANSLLGFLVDAPSSAIPLPSTGPNVYILGIGAGTVKSNNASSVMQSALTVAPQLAAHLPLSLATVTALADAAGNHASLVGQSPLHSFKVSLTLVRNAEFNPALVYQRAPVESPRDVFPLNSWTPPLEPLQYDMTLNSGDTRPPLQAALEDFFSGLLGALSLSNDAALEVGTSLIWNKGALTFVTPVSILPADVVASTYPSAGKVADFVLGVCVQLLGGAALVPPAEADAASIRLRVKLTEPLPAVTNPPLPSPRTLLEISAIDFPIKTQSTLGPDGNSNEVRAGGPPLSPDRKRYRNFLDAPDTINKRK
jgi:hypothetical protein